MIEELKKQIYRWDQEGKLLGVAGPPTLEDVINKVNEIIRYLNEREGNHFRESTKMIDEPVKDCHGLEEEAQSWAGSSAVDAFKAGVEWQKKHKPAEWDKEDKEMFEAVDESLYCYESGKAPEAVAQIEAERCWLSSLPERFNLQPKQEWSEEEIIYWNTIKDYFFGIPFDDKLKSALDWFKSLKPSWKPSEEQLPGIEDPGIPGKDFIPVDWVDACEKYGKWKIVKVK